MKKAMKKAMKKGMKKRMGCKADGEVKYRSNLMVVRILTRRPTKQTAFYSPFPYSPFPARCFSQAHAEARVSSRLRSAFQPSSLLARVVSAQIATVSPARRGANL